jgi:hemoglobin
MQFSKAKYNTITRENINEMVLTFYTQILEKNNDVSKVFTKKLGEDINSEIWKEHIETLTDFWARIALEDTKYDGNPMRAHLDLSLKRDMFGDWLVVFYAVLDSMYEDHLAIIFKSRAENIACNFMRNLGI